MLNQKKKLHLTSITALILQLLTLVYGFILPRLFLGFYGSAINGLVSSIAQFLGFISLAECGVGAVVQSALYKPLANKDERELSRIIVSAEHFFRNIAKLLVVYTIILALLYPYIIKADYTFIFTASLICIIAISSFAQYYFGITYRLLLNSDQFGFIPYIVQIVALVLNLGLSAALMYNGASVHVVKLVSSIIFLAQPLSISFIAHRWYKIDRRIAVDKEAIPQKWNGLAQHISSVVLQSSGIAVLTIFSTLENVSVYAIYFLVVQGVRNLTMSVTNGMQAFLGNIFAKGEMVAFKSNFEKFEWKLHFVVTLVFTSTAVLIVPFVSVYTSGITDVNYIVPTFGVLLTAAWGMYCIRLPYNIVVLAVGHYKQTQNSAIVEAILNLVTASLLALKFGLIGVAIGTLVAMIYRTSYLAWYISRNVINRSLWPFVKHLIVDIIIAAFIIVVLFKLDGVLYCDNPANYLDWIVLAGEKFVICLIITCIINAVFYKKNMVGLMKRG